MTGLRGVNGVDAKTTGLVRCTGKNFEIQSHAATLYANAARLESRVFGNHRPRAACVRTSHAPTQPVTSTDSRTGTLPPWAQPLLSRPIHSLRRTSNGPRP